MTSTIAPLDRTVVSQLRSSLVISSVEQCVRELVYNSLDADATSIHITVDISKFYVRVIDNGKGLSEAELKQMAVRHTTSKCRCVQDLQTLHTMGYRGEALASLADASVLQIVSRKKETAGVMGIWKDGKLLQLSSAQCQAGTTVTVRDLFYKFPVRRKHIQQEKCLDIVKKTILSIALAFSHVSFNLVDGAHDNKLLVTKRSSSTLDVLGQLFGYSFRQFIRSFEYNDDVYSIRLSGYFGIRAHLTKNYQYIYINRRQLPPNRLYKVAIETFANSILLNKGSSATDESQRVHGLLDKHPIFFIYIDYPSLNSYNVDQFLILLQEHQLFTHVEILVRNLIANFLRTHNQISSTQYASLVQSSEPPKKRARTAGKSQSNIVERSLSSIHGLDDTQYHVTRTNPQKPTLYHMDEPDYEYISNSQDTNRIDRTHLRRSRPSTGSSWKEKIHLASQDSSGTEMSQRVTKRDLATSQTLYQVDSKFILIKIPHSGLLLLIDQHAADERIKLERMQELLSDNVESMQLDPSIHVNLSEQEQRVAERYASYLERWGIHLKKSLKNLQQSSISSPGPSILRQATHFLTGEKSPFFQHEGVWVTRLPQLIADRCVVDYDLLRDVIREYIHWLEEQGPSASPDVCPKGIMQILKSKACRGAIMFNDVLTHDECEWLVRSLARCDFPFQCAHGRPSMVPIINIDNQTSKRHRLHWNGSLRNKLFKDNVD